MQDELQLECYLAAYGLDQRGTLQDDQLKIAAARWRLLLQVDTDGIPGFEWGDTGCIYYWIDERDFAARNFDNVWLVLQSA